MMNHSIKRKMAAVLCAAILLGQAAPVVPALHGTAYADEENTEKVFSGSHASGSNASSETASDGSISGGATFSGSTVVAKLYKGGSQVSEKTLPDGGGSFTFSGLSAGDYVVRYFFWGEGGTVLDQNSVPVGYHVVEEPEETETPEPEETQTPAPKEPEKPEESDNSGNTGNPQEINPSIPKLGAVSPQAELEGNSLHQDESNASVSKKASSAENADGEVKATVSFTGSGPVYVEIFLVENGSATKKGSETVSENTTVTFDGLPAGSYLVNYSFGGDVEKQDSVTVGVVESGSDDQENPPAPETKKVTETAVSALKASSATESDGEISGTVTFTGEGPINVGLYVKETGTPVGFASVQTTGGGFTFSNLPAGEYQINYAFPDEQELAYHETKTVEVREAETEPDAGTKTIQTEVTVKNVSADGQSDGEISGEVKFTGEGPVNVGLYVKETGAPVGFASVEESGGGFAFTNLPAGEYQINYAFPDEPELAHHETATVGVEPAVPVNKITDIISAKTDVTAAGKEDGTITGSVEFTGSSKIVAKLYADGSTTKLKEATISATGGSFSFTDLAAGKYTVDFHFWSEGVSETRTFEIGVIPPTVAKIDITSVAAGEKTLTVKGTAQAGAQILVQAKPAGAKAEVLVVGTDGKFETSLSADPGTYTEVSAYYVTDAASLVSKGGSWTVTEPAAAPDIVIDPVDNYCTTVVVKTGANLAVTLKTPDSTQTLESDANGLVYFSLTHKYLKGEEFTVTVVYGSGSGKTVTKKVTVGGAADYKDLEYGDYGEAVLRLTTRLNELGYPVAPTKNYNSTVREAVRLFQLANGLEADGEAGDRMQAALFSVSAIRFGSGRYPTLVRGDQGLALIKTLQQRLKDLGYYTIKVDGIFGSGTQRAVRLFQQVNGLPVTGIADNATQVLLYSSAAKPIGYGTSGSYQTLQRSSKYKSAVVPLQRRLKELGYYSGSIDGYFGSKTYRAVRNFQSRNGLKVTGVADPLTQQLLYSAAAKKYNGSVAGSSSSTSTGYRLLYWGCRGDAVKRLQNALIDAGYKKYVRSADGIFGQWTYDAVCAYQRDHGLAVDGIAGKKTQNSLYGTNY